MISEVKTEIDDSDKRILEKIIAEIRGWKEIYTITWREPRTCIGRADGAVLTYNRSGIYPFKEAQGVMQIMDHQFVNRGRSGIPSLWRINWILMNIQKVDLNSFLRGIG